MRSELEIPFIAADRSGHFPGKYQIGELQARS